MLRLDSLAAASVTNTGLESDCINDPSEVHFLADIEFESLSPWSWYPTPDQCSMPDWSEKVNAEEADRCTVPPNQGHPSITVEPESICDDSHFSGSHDTVESAMGTAGDSIFELTWLDDSAATQCLPSPSTVSAPILPPPDGTFLYEGLFEKFGVLLDKCMLLPNPCVHITCNG